jgi:hypothetical protein
MQTRDDQVKLRYVNYPVCAAFGDILGLIDSEEGKKRRAPGGGRLLYARLLRCSFGDEQPPGCREELAAGARAFKATAL